MRRGIVATIAIALLGCPSPPDDPDGGAGGGSSASGGGSGGSGGSSGGAGGSGGLAGELCANAIELPATGGTVTSDATAARDDYQGGCALDNTTGGRELVYHLNLPTPRSVTISATEVAGVDPVLYVRASPCQTGATLACADGTADGDTEMIFLPYAVGDLYIFADALDPATSGESTLTVSLGTAIPPPANDTCAAAMPLTFVMDRASASGDTTGADNSNLLASDGGVAPSPSCTATAQLYGQDVVYSFTVGQGRNVSVSLTAPDGGLDPAVYVRRSCESNAVADELTCGAGTFSLSNLDAGTYYLWVDALNGTFGTFDLSVTLSDFAPPPSNDVCVSDGGSGATPLPADGGTLPGTLAGASSDIAASCGAGGSPDVAYTITTTQTADLVATVTTMDAMMQPVVFIRSGCALGGFDLACAAASGGGQPATATALNAPPGTYVVWVESLTTPAAFTLSLQVRSATGVPANDTCIGATPLLAGGLTQQTVTGSTRTATDNTSSVCSGGGANLFYSVTLSQQAMLTARVTPTEDGGYFPSVHLRGAIGCRLDGGVDSGVAGCANGGTPNDSAELIVGALDAGTYLLVVEGVGGTRGAFSLDVSTAAPAGVAANDTCATATQLTFQNGQAQVVGSIRGAANNHTGSCFSSGGDVVYGFRTPDAGFLDGGTVNVKAVVWTNDVVETLVPVVFVQRGCFPDAGSVVCDGTGIAAPLFQSRVNAWAARPGTPYTVWIDHGTAEPGGFFTLRVSMAAAPPANDACPNAAALPLNTSVAGSTLGAGNHFQGIGAGGFYSGNAACGNALTGADVVFQFTAAQAGLHVVRVQPERGFNPGLGVTRACATGMCVDTVDTAGENLPEQISFMAAAGMTYFVTVDSATDVPTNGAARGGFVVSVQSP